MARDHSSHHGFTTCCNNLGAPPISVVSLLYCCFLSLLPGASLGVLVEELTALCAPRQFSFGKLRLSEWQCVPAGTRYRHCPLNFNIAHMQNGCVCLLWVGAETEVTNPSSAVWGWVVRCLMVSYVTTCMKTDMRNLQGSLWSQLSVDNFRITLAGVKNWKLQLAFCSISFLCFIPCVPRDQLPFQHFSSCMGSSEVLQHFKWNCSICFCFINPPLI